MRTRMICLVALCLLGVAAAPKSFRKKTPSKSTGVIYKYEALAIPPARAVAIDDVPARWNITVDSGLDLDETGQALHDRMAAAIGGYTDVPAARIAYHSGYQNYNILTWRGTVMNVQANGNGTYNVHVVVAPGKVNDNEDFPCVLSDYSEIFTVDANDSVTYSASLDPEGWAGLPPMFELH